MYQEKIGRIHKEAYRLSRNEETLNVIEFFKQITALSSYYNAMKTTKDVWWLSPLTWTLMGNIESQLRRYTRTFCKSVGSIPSLKHYSHDIQTIKMKLEMIDEKLTAKRAMYSENGKIKLLQRLSGASYWTTPKELISPFFKSRNILVVGSGPLPMTAISIAKNLDASVTCVEKDAESCNLSHGVLKYLGLGGRIRLINESVENLNNLHEFDGIFASLQIGIGCGKSPSDSRAIAMEVLLDGKAAGVPVVTRQPFELHWIRYAPLLPNFIRKHQPSFAVPDWHGGPPHPSIIGVFQ